jgi:hypothetical protein
MEAFTKFLEYILNSLWIRYIFSGLACVGVVAFMEWFKPYMEKKLNTKNKKEITKIKKILSELIYPFVPLVFSIILGIFLPLFINMKEIPLFANIFVSSLSYFGVIYLLYRAGLKIAFTRIFKIFKRS